MWSRQSRTRWSRHEKAAATTQTVASARTSERRHGPGREFAPPHGGQGRESGVRGELRVKASGTPPLSQAAGVQHFFLDDDESPATRGSRPDALLAASGPQERVLRNTVEQLVDCVPVVPLLDVPVPQMVDQLVHVLKKDVEWVIAVPKIALQDGGPSSRRSSRTAAGGTVGGSPTILYFLEQIVDILVPGACLRRRGDLPGSPEQGSAALLDAPQQQFQ